MTFKIDIEHSETSEHQILVLSPSTSHVNISNILDAEDKVKTLRENIDFIYAQAKIQGFKVKHKHPEYNGKRKYANYINKVIESYLEDVKQYQEIYAELRPKWESKVNKGLFAPLSDDTEYNGLVEHGWKLDAMHHRNKPIGLFDQIYFDISMLQMNIEAENNISFVTL